MCVFYELMQLHAYYIPAPGAQIQVQFHIRTQSFKDKQFEVSFVCDAIALLTLQNKVFSI